MLAEARKRRFLGSACGDGVRSVGGVLECGHNRGSRVESRGQQIHVM